MSVNNEATEIKREGIEDTQSIFNIKQEIQNTQQQTTIKQEAVVKQEFTDKQEICTSKETQTQTQTEDTLPLTVIPKRIPNPNARPKRPQRNALSLAKIASIDTKNLFVYNNNNGDTLSDKQATKEPQIETEMHRNLVPFNVYSKSKKRKEIDTLFGRYDTGIEIFNEDGSMENCEVTKENKSVSPADTDLELLLAPPKRMRWENKTAEKSEIDEITQKYDFIQTDNSLTEYEDAVLNKSVSTAEFTVRVKCERTVHSFQMKHDTPFSETIEKLAEELGISPKQIMLMLSDETVLPADTLTILSLDENTLLEAIILSAGFVSPARNEEPKIKIKVQFAKNLCGQVQIMAPVTADLKGILTQICESKNLTPSDFQLQFDGDSMQLSNSLLDYSLEDGDVIDAIMVT